MIIYMSSVLKTVTSSVSVADLMWSKGLKPKYLVVFLQNPRIPHTNIVTVIVLVVVVF